MTVKNTRGIARCVASPQVFYIIKNDIKVIGAKRQIFYTAYDGICQISNHKIEMELFDFQNLVVLEGLWSTQSLVISTLVNAHLSIGHFDPWSVCTSIVPKSTHPLCFSHLFVS